MFNPSLNPERLDSPPDLKSRWQALRTAEPDLRIRDAAGRLGVSEAELLALDCGGPVTRLAADWGELIQLLPRLGPVMALTRNDQAVHEKRGCYRNISIEGNQGLVLDENIDLRLFLNRWHSGFAVTEEIRGRLRRSLHFFDAAGTAVHKVYLEENSDAGAYEALVERYCSKDQAPVQDVTPTPAAAGDRPDAAVDRDALMLAWRALQDTHDFFPMLKAHAVGRLQALRLADRDLAYPVQADSAERVLSAAAATGTPIMVFVGSPGVIQIHTGPVHAISKVGPWLNVMDETFNLHLRNDRVESAWVVRKPTADGVVTSLELYDGDGGVIAQLFGKRKPGEAELSDWRVLLSDLGAPAEAAAGVEAEG
jgi:putative hemin transport protein